MGGIHPPLRPLPFADLAQSPRPAGSDAETRARDLVRDSLVALGFTTRDHSFTYSAWPGRWGTSTIGIVLVAAAGIVAVTPYVGAALVLVAIAGMGGWLIARYGTMMIPVLRRSGINLEAIRTFGHTANANPVDAWPDVWLVAHLDSKSQPIPMLVRVTGVIVTVLVWAGVLITFGATLIARVGPVAPASAGSPEVVWVPFAWLGVAGIVGALPIALSLVGSHSDGALDNASGVATLLAAATYLRDGLPQGAALGVLITSAEELGLAGAQAWLAARSPSKRRGIAVNFDGVDDGGRLVCMVHRSVRARLGNALVRAGRMCGTAPAIRMIIPGVLVDAVPFQQAGWDSVTISHGGWASLVRIHTRRDDLAHMSGASIDKSARYAAELVKTVVRDVRGKDAAIS